ncbi:MoaD/ThiS family protein [bacterium]|nr:MAG: MoaD/ThiS family protein [bacterium]
MKIELKLYAQMASLKPKEVGRGPWALEVSEGTTVKNLLEELKVPRESVKLVFLNGVHASDDDILKEGDRVGVFPAVAGG